MDHIKSQEEILEQLVASSLGSTQKKVDLDFTVKGVGTLHLQVKTYLDLAESLFFVDKAVKIAVSEEGGFIPEVSKFAFGVAVLEHFAGVQLPTDIDEQYALVFGTDLVERILDKVNPSHLENLQESVEYRLASMVEESAFLKLESTLSQLSNLLDHASGLTKAVNPEEMTEVMELVRGFASKEGNPEEKAAALYLEEMRVKAKELELEKLTKEQSLNVMSASARELELALWEKRENALGVLEENGIKVKKKSSKGKQKKQGVSEMSPTLEESHD